MTILPKIPSKLIRIALADIEKVEADPRLVVDMDYWVEGGEMCAACFAGAVMLFTLAEFDDYKDLSLAPNDYEENYWQLRALDFLRIGDLSPAFVYLGLHGQDEAITKCKRSITPYDKSPEQFKEDMNNLANDLEKAGY